MMLFIKAAAIGFGGVGIFLLFATGLGQLAEWMVRTFGDVMAFVLLFGLIFGSIATVATYQYLRWHRGQPPQ